MTTNNAARNVEDVNFHHLVRDIAWFGIALAASTRFMSIYAIRLGATPTDLGWLASLPALVLMISSGFGLWWRRRYSDTTRAVIWPSFAFRFAFLLPAFAPFLPRDLQPLWLILSITLPAIPQGVSSVIFLIMMREAVYEKRMTALLSRRSLAMNITIAGGALAFGVWLEAIPFPINYQLMFVFAFIATLMSLWHVSRINSAVHPAPVPLPRRAPLPGTTSPWRSPSFLRVAFIIVVIYMAFYSVFPLVPLQLVDGLGAAEGFMALFGMVELAAGAGVSMITGWLVRRIGNRTMIALAMVGTGLSVLVVALATNQYMTLLAAALNGASWTAAGIGLFGFFTESTPEADVTRHTTAYMQVVALAMFAGPLIGSQLAASGVHLVTVLLIGVVLRLVAAALTESDFSSLVAAPRWTRRRVATKQRP